MDEKEVYRDYKERLENVAAYCRVSTYEETQAGSFELQVQYYKDLIKRNSSYRFVNIYADEGVSGTSVVKRVEFQKMLEDARNHKIDLIITKNVARFARNMLDSVSVARELKQLTPPVGVFFENENYNTLDPNGEFTLALLSLIAQGESE